MTVKCTVCTGAYRAEVDDALWQGRPPKRIAKETGLSFQAILRHRDNHHRARYDAAYVVPEGVEVKRPQSRPITDPPAEEVPHEGAVVLPPPIQPTAPLPAPPPLPRPTIEVEGIRSWFGRRSYVSGLFLRGQWKDVESQALLLDAWCDLSPSQLDALTAEAAVCALFARGPYTTRRLVSIGKVTQIRDLALEAEDFDAAIKAQVHLDKLEGLLRPPPTPDQATELANHAAVVLLLRKVAAKHPDLLDVVQNDVVDAFNGVQAAQQVLEVGAPVPAT